MRQLSRQNEWRLISLTSAVAAALLVRAGFKAAWKVTTNDEPPLNPMRQNADWTSAIVFAAAMGFGAGIARLGARTIAAWAWDESA